VGEQQQATDQPQWITHPDDGDCIGYITIDNIRNGDANDRAESTTAWRRRWSGHPNDVRLLAVDVPFYGAAQDPT
jgi:hypothetical protein